MVCQRACLRLPGFLQDSKLDMHVPGTSLGTGRYVGGRHVLVDTPMCTWTSSNIPRSNDVDITMPSCHHASRALVLPDNYRFARIDNSGMAQGSAKLDGKELPAPTYANTEALHSSQRGAGGSAAAGAAPSAPPAGPPPPPAEQVRAHGSLTLLPRDGCRQRVTHGTPCASRCQARAG